MLAINVLLSGRLKLDGYARGHLEDGDGTVRLSLAEGSGVWDVVERLGVPADRVAMIMVNGHQCSTGTALRSGDRVILIPPDVAALWRFLGLQNLGAPSVLEF
jgi:molybdopterin converting factor small subunit